MKIEYAIIIKNKTRLETLIERFNTKAQARFYIESSGGFFEEYEQEHEIFHEALRVIQIQLSKVIKYKIVEREFLPSYIFSDKNLIIVVGQDGLVANTAKYSKGLPIVAVNPDQKRYDGVLLPFNASDFIGGVEAVLGKTSRLQVKHFAEARLNNGQRLLAFNDLFIGAATHVSARYKILYEDQEEEQSSSGIIVSTQAGSTGWLSSVFTMAYGITGLFGEEVPLGKPEVKNDQLLFTVREPFKSVRTGTDVMAGFITSETHLRIKSLMPVNGVIFSDGIESDFLHFNSGSVVSVGIAEETASLVGK